MVTAEAPGPPGGDILVVDDSETKRFATVSVLMSAGFGVLEAETGKDGLWLAAARRPILIVLDVNLPDMSGFDVVARLKARSATAAIPVLHLSATRIEPKDRAKGLEGGADAYLAGHVEAEELLATVNALLRAKRTEGAATSSARQWQATFDAIGDGVCLVDGSGCVQQCNRQMAKLLAQPIHAVIGRPLGALMAAALELSLGEGPAAAPNPRPTAKEVRGGARWFWHTVDPILDEAGLPSGTVQTLREITLRKQEHLELQEAKSGAEVANQTKSAFLANMSHEIRSPLGAIIGYAELLKDEQLAPAERQQFLQTIVRNGQQVVLLIDDILDLAKVEAGRLEVELIPFSLLQLLADVELSLGAKARKKGVALRIRVDPSLPELVVSDPTRLRQILVNIAGNALKFTEQGTVEIDVRQVSRGAGAAALLEFSVKDTGYGVAEDQQAKLFQPFTQADSSTTRRFGGTGLGLILSRKLARALGGELVLARSTLGEGSTFVLTIAPSRLAPGLADAPQAPQPPVDTEAAEPSLVGLSILVADDAPDNRLLIARFLSKYGAAVELAENGREAVAAALARDYHVVVMDMQMPVVDGYTATRELRRLGYAKPIIALTAHAMRGEREKSLQAGCDDHLTKPFTARFLARRVAHYALAPRQPAAPSA